MVDPGASPYATLLSLLKSRTTPSAKAICKTRLLLVATRIGFRRAGSSLLVMLPGIAVKFATVLG
jgi:hypothetical protein